MIVLDTTVVSELMRPAPDPGVLSWLRAQAPGTLTTTAVTIAEIRFGLALLPEGRRARQLRETAESVLASFPTQVLPFDAAAAAHNGDLAAAREGAGRPISAFDAQIAAICRSRSNTLATRNTTDFLDTGLTLLDPWQR